jgi:hypothetical protein
MRRGAERKQAYEARQPPGIARGGSVGLKTRAESATPAKAGSVPLAHVELSAASSRAGLKSLSRFAGDKAQPRKLAKAGCLVGREIPRSARPRSRME